MIRQYRIIQKYDKFFPQYSYLFLPFWLSFKELIYDSSSPEPMLTRAIRFSNESDACLFLINKGISSFRVFKII